MLLIAGAIVAGILVGLALGGSLRTLAEIRLRWWLLALIGLAMQLAPVPSGSARFEHWEMVALLIGSYALLLFFVAANIRLPGFGLIAVGLLLNVLAISVNGGMPVSRDALLRAYGPQYRGIVVDIDETGGAKHHLARDDDVLIPLTDVIPLGPPVRLVLSVGDVLFFLGVAWVIAGATKGPPGRHRPGVRRGRHERRATERLELPETPRSAPAPSLPEGTGSIAGVPMARPP